MYDHWTDKPAQHNRPPHQQHSSIIQLCLEAAEKWINCFEVNAPLCFISSRRIKQVITRKLIAEPYWGIKQTPNQMEGEMREKNTYTGLLGIILEAGHDSCLSYNTINTNEDLGNRDDVSRILKKKEKKKGRKDLKVKKPITLW